MIYLTIRVACVISSASFNSRKVSLYVQLVFVCSFLRDSLSHNLVFQAVMFKLSEGCEFFFFKCVLYSTRMSQVLAVLFAC